MQKYAKNDYSTILKPKAYPKQCIEKANFANRSDNSMISKNSSLT